MRTLPRSALFVAALSSLAPVLAQAAGPPAPAAADPSAEAREHYNRGRKLYDLNRYDEAIKEFEAGYELKDDPVFLYNIAQSYRLAGRYSEALRFYRNFLRNAPRSPKRAEVEQKIADMEKLSSEQVSPAPTPPRPVPVPPAPGPSVTNPPPRPAAEGTSPAQPGPDESKEGGEVKNPPPLNQDTSRNEPAPARPGKGKLVAGIVVGVVGVAALGTGIALSLLAQQAASDQQASTVFLPDTESRGQTFGIVGPVLIGVGAAALAAGVGVAVWGALQRPERAARSTTRRLAVVPSLGSSFAGGNLRMEF